MLTALVLVGGLSFPVPADDSLDLYCAQVERRDRTWVICTEEPLDADDVDGIVRRGEKAVRERVGKDGGEHL